MRIIFESKNSKYRIIQKEDISYDMENLKGDVFNPNVVKEISPADLQKEELEFEELVNREGVFGFILEQWDPTPGVGWTHVDSCWGFVGAYTETYEKFKHYIVEELMNKIPEGEK